MTELSNNVVRIFLTMTGVFLVIGMAIVNRAKSGYGLGNGDTTVELIAKFALICLIAICIAIVIRSWKAEKQEQYALSNEVIQ